MIFVTEEMGALKESVKLCGSMPDNLSWTLKLFFQGSEFSYCLPLTWQVFTAVSYCLKSSSA